MEKQHLIRIGTDELAYEAELDTYDSFDLLFDGFHEFVQIFNYHPLRLVNGTKWTGALGHLMDDH
jgi:hypothetical protein